MAFTLDGVVKNKDFGDGVEYVLTYSYPYYIFFLADFLKLADFFSFFFCFLFFFFVTYPLPKDCRNARVKQKPTTNWIYCLDSLRVL